MELLPDELRAQLPPLYAQEHEKDKMVYLKFFSPYSNWTWYVTEGEQEEYDELDNNDQEDCDPYALLHAGILGPGFANGKERDEI